MDLIRRNIEECLLTMYKNNQAEVTYFTPSIVSSGNAREFRIADFIPRKSFVMFQNEGTYSIVYLSHHSAWTMCRSCFHYLTDQALSSPIRTASF